MDNDSTVHSSWARIHAWLMANAPVTAGTLRPPAPTAAVVTAQQSTAVKWPEQLLTWFSLHDGWERQAWASVLPGWSSPMSLTRCLQDWQMQQEVWKDIADDDEDVAERLDQGGQEAAGEYAGVFLPSFIPIDEDQSGDVLFIDCRPGPRQGCVTHWMKHDFDSYGLGWWSIAQMLTDVADHLEDQSPCRSWRPLIEDGSLRWRLETTVAPSSPCLARVPS